MQAVMAKTNEVCLRYLDNSMLYSLPVPSTTYYETSICAVRNRRRKMEDRHVAIHDLNTMFNIQEASPSSYYAIFDGHAGHDAAAYSAAHLHQFLAENRYFISNPEQALLDAFCKTDALFLEKCKVENLTGGTTAVVALLRPKENTLYIAWVGDSQALLANQGKILQCVNPHKPCREDERERIEKAGGCVMLWGTWRVNGQLAVSRAIGDADYKPHVIAIPDVKEISLDGGEDFLIIACDGLWDFLTEDAAAQEVYYKIAQNPDDTERIGKHLAQLARYQGSTDNISVIVVFLREPHQIAAEAHRWATKNGQTLTTDNMETGLDNANNPFTNSNGSLKNLEVDTENIELRKDNEGLLLNLADSFKTHVRDIQQEIFMTEKSNGTKNSASDINFDDDFGPETDVDAVDDAFSPIEKEKAFTDGLTKGLQDESFPNDEVKAVTEGLANNNPLELNFNPFKNDENIKEENGIKMGFDDFHGANREETPTPPIDTVHDVGGLEVNPTESDSEDEWNYIKGDQAKPETLSSQPETVVEASEQEDAMSQLNPDAAEFVPISPTRSIPSPACAALIHDEVISRSPQRAAKVDIKVPSEIEFESEVKSRPSDFDEYKNGHEPNSEHKDSTDFQEIEKILNGKNIDEIPEFHPGSTPTKQPLDEFHFGPNAAPFTPKALDQSEPFSTKAYYGDESQQILNDSEFVLPSREQTDPMSTSFYAEKGESNPFQDEEDLNKVHVLPDNLDDFIKDANNDKENSLLDDTISDLPEHDPLGERLLDNDQAAIQTTDLDKISQDDEKELASPLEEDLLDVPSNDNVMEKSLEEKVISEEFEFVNNAPLDPVVLEDEMVAPVVPEKVEEPNLMDQNRLENMASEFSFDSKPPEIDFETPQSPVCELKSPKDDPKSEVENIQSEIKESTVTSSIACEYTATSPVPVCEEAASSVLVCEAPLSCEESHSRDLMEAEKQETLSPFPPEEKQEEEIVSYSPIEQKHDEEVTSSVKDDVSSPIEPLSPVKSPESLIEDIKTNEAVSTTATQVHNEVESQNIVPDLLCPLPASQEIIAAETTEINALETGNQLFVLNETGTNGFNNFAAEFNEQVCIKTDSITPEFAEPAVITPSEESKVDEIVAESPVPSQTPDLLVSESIVDEKAAEVPKPEEILSEEGKETATVAPLLLAPVVQEEKSTKVEEKKPTSAKKPLGKVEPKKPTSASKVGATKAPVSAPKAASKTTSTAKTGTAKPTGGATKTTSSTTATSPKAAAKPKTLPLKSIDKKPALNGEVKPAPRTTLTKKPATEVAATKTTTRPATSTAPKASPAKTTAPRPATAPRTLAPKASAPPKPASAAAPKPRAPLSSRTTATASKTTAATTTKTTTSSTAAKTPSAPKTTSTAPSKPKTLTSVSPKPRVPLTKTITKSADVEKEKKDSANKLTASRTTTTSSRTTGTVSSKTTATTVKKTEIKPSTDKIASRTTKTTTMTKKPSADLKTTKTKTTKVEKPKENGVAPTTVTQEIKEITIVNNVINQSDSENLVKDNSPLDNKLLIETNNGLIDANPAD